MSAQHNRWELLDYIEPGTRVLIMIPSQWHELTEYEEVPATLKHLPGRDAFYFELEAFPNVAYPSNTVLYVSVIQ